MTSNYSINNKSVGPTGYGLMGFSWNPDHVPSDEVAFKALKTAVENNVTFWNGGEFYGRPKPESNLQLISRYFEKYPEDADKVYLSIKGGVEQLTWQSDGSPEKIDESIGNCIKFLDGKKSLDMFTLARIGKVPLEESVTAIKKHLDAGTIKGICLSEVSAESIRKASKIAKISAVEIEFSLWSREAETNGVFEVCKELGIPIISYSPVGKGLLTGQLKPENLSSNDFRGHFDRFQEDNYKKNLVLIEKIAEIAKRKNATSAQIALSWIRTLSNTGKYPVIIPIPGTTNPDRVVENSTHIDLTEEDLKEIEDFLSGFKVAGYRYNEHMEGHNYR